MAPDPPMAGDGRPEPTSDANGRPEDDLLGPDLRASRLEKRLGDFTTSAKVLRLLPFALVIGALGAVTALGGALGSVIAQFFHLSAIERRTLLVAGAAAGMSAVFGTPVAAVVLGVELLVFEWRPRSMVLIAVASAVADGMRMALVDVGLLDAAPLFPKSVTVPAGASTLLGGVVIGLAGGAAAWVLT